MNKSNLIIAKELDQLNHREYNESFNISNLNSFQNDLSEVGKGMKYKMDKQVVDNEFCQICFKRDSSVISENSLYEKNQQESRPQNFNNQKTQDESFVFNKNNNQFLYSKSNVNQATTDREVEGVFKFEQINKGQYQTQKQNSDKIDNKLNDTMNQQLSKQDQEQLNRTKNISDQISQNSPLLKKQQSKKMKSQYSNHSGLNDSTNRNQMPFTFNGPDSSINKPNPDITDTFDIQNNNLQINTKKKPPTFSKSNNGMKSKKNQKSENFVKMKSEMFKLFTFIKPKIKKFLSNRTVLGRTKQLTSQVRLHINDYSDFNVISEKKNLAVSCFIYFLNLLENVCSKLRLNKLPLFDPENVFKIIFNTIIVIYNWFYIILISLQIFFGAYSKYDKMFTLIAEVAWISEMVVQMNTACYHKNQFTKDRKLIMKIYLKEYFFFEVIPLIFQQKTSSNRYIYVLLRLPLLLKLKGMMIIVKKLEFYILLSIKRHYFLQLFNLVAETLLLGHLIACIWNSVAEFQIGILDVQDTWKQNSNVDTSQWYNVYIDCMYYAFATMMTVGTNPHTIMEKSFTAMFMLVCSMQLAFIISTIDQIISEINKSNREYKEDLNVLNQYMRRKKIDLQGKQKAFMSSEFQKGNKKKLITLKHGQCFGIYGFFTGIERFVNAYSNNFSTIIKIDRKKMIEILKENQRDYEKFMEIKDKIYFDQNYKDLNLECFVCKSTDHLFDKCDRTHFHKQNPIIYYRFNYSTSQKRKNQQRKSNKKKNIMLSIPLHSEKIQKLREEYNLQDDEDEDEDYDDVENEYYSYEEDEDEEDLDLENDPNSVHQDNFSIQQHLQNEDSEINVKNSPVSPTANIHSTIYGNNFQYANQSILDQQDEDNQPEKNKAYQESDIDNALDRDTKNERQVSNSSSQDIQSLSRSEDRNFDQEQLEPKSKKSLHYLNKKDRSEIQELSEKVKSQESAVFVQQKVRSSLRNDSSQIDQDENQQITQKKVVKIKNPQQGKRRQSQSRSLISQDKQLDQQVEELVNAAQIQTAPTFGQNQKIISQEFEPQSRRQSMQQSLQQKMKYEKSQSKVNRRASIKQNLTNRVSIMRNATLSNNAQNQQLLFKKIGSHFSPVTQMPGDEIPFYWRMDVLKDYVAYYPEYNSNFVIKRVHIFQSFQNRKKQRLQKKLAQSLQTANLTRLKTNQFSPRRQGQVSQQQNQPLQLNNQQSQQHSQVIQNQQIPSTIKQKTVTKSSQFESDI